jgi:hypothetical protein
VLRVAAMYYALNAGGFRKVVIYIFVAQIDCQGDFWIIGL